MNALFQGAVDVGHINKGAAIAEINALIKWQEERKKWHQDKTRQKMAADSSLPNGSTASSTPGSTTFRSSDFGLNESDLADLDNDDDDSEDEEELEDDNADPIASERKRRRKQADRLRRSAGEPIKPVVKELSGMRDGFLSMLRMVLAD